MQNSTCPIWRALESYMGHTAALRHWLCATLGIPDHHACVLAWNPCLDSLILLLDFTDSQHATNNEPCGGCQVAASAARQWHASRAATVSQMGFPFFFFNHMLAALTTDKNFDKIRGRHRK